MSSCWGYKGKLKWSAEKPCEPEMTLKIAM
jgi:hypothetical protein